MGKMWKRGKEERGERTEGTRKRTLIHACICVGLLVVIWGGYFFSLEKMNQRIESVQEDNFGWVVQVDEARIEKNEFVLKGFAFGLNKNAEEGTFAIVLHNLDTDEYLFPRMEYEERRDVNDYFLCEYDYTNSGFTATIKEKKLDLNGNDYEVLLLPEWSNSPYRFTTYLDEGDLMYVNPKEYVPLDVAGTELEEIVEKGMLRVYEPENHIYVYQYDGELYWIADEECEFIDEGNTYIDCMASTTQPNLLPESRKKLHYTNDNLDFFFQNNELMDANTNGYRVAKIGIPSEYSVTSILTGHRVNDEWVWKDYFRIHYQFAEGDMKYE